MSTGQERAEQGDQRVIRGPSEGHHRVIRWCIGHHRVMNHLRVIRGDERLSKSTRLVTRLVTNHLGL